MTSLADKVLKIERMSEGRIKVHYENGVYLGDFLVKEDGFWDFWPEVKGGYWPAHLLIALGENLNELNKPYEEELEKYFNARPD